MRFYRRPEKCLNFRKLENCYICSLEIKRASAVMKLCLSSSSIPLQNVAKDRKFFGKCRSYLRVVELRICCTSVHGKRQLLFIMGKYLEQCSLLRIKPTLLIHFFCPQIGRLYLRVWFILSFLFCFYGEVHISLMQ